MSEWKRHQLRELCTDIIDCVNKTAPISEEETPYRMLRTSDIREGRINLENLNCVSEETFRKWSRRGALQNGDVILTREAPLGEVGLVRDATNLFLGQRLVLFRANPLVCDNRFLLYALLHHDNKQAIIAKGVGATVLHLRVPECEKIEISAPNVEIQRRIADILSAYDDLIENNQKQIKLLEEAAQRLYREWFVELRFPGHETVPVVDGVPEGWEQKTLDDIAVESGRGEKKENRQQYDVYLPIDCLPKHSLSYIETAKIEDAESSLVGFAEGDILFGAMRPYFHKVVIARHTGLTRSTCFVLNARNEVMWAYVVMLLFSKDAVDYATQNSVGTTMPYVRWKDMRQMPVLVPSVDVVKRFQMLIKPMMTKAMRLAEQMKDAQEARDRLLPKLMSGEVEV